MFRRIATPVCLALFAFAAVAANAAPAQAARYGSFVVNNPSNTPINYAVQWGDGEVEVFTVGEYKASAHYYELDENGEIPGPTITFDCKGGDGEDTLTLLSYDLDAYLVDDPFAGKEYTFRYSSGGVFLDLYEG